MLAEYTDTGGGGLRADLMVRYVGVEPASLKASLVFQDSAVELHGPQGE